MRTCRAGSPQLSAWSLAAGLVLGATGCTGSIGALGSDDDGPGGASGVPGAGPGGGAGGAGTVRTPEDEARRAANPSLAETALKYFPGNAGAAAPERIFRLTRRQLDATARAVVSGYLAESVVSVLPRDPLQTNYEYADNLAFNTANFTPYVNWAKGIADRVRADPTKIVNCSASGVSPECVAGAVRSFVNRAFRGVAPPETVERFVSFHSTEAAELGLAEATADLVDVVLGSPHFVFREEMRTDAAGALLPAARLQQMTYALADAPPEAVGFGYGAPENDVGTPEATVRTVDRILATAEARDKLQRFFGQWLEVREADEFTIDAQAFPEFTPAVAAAVVEETRAFLARQLAGAAPRLRDVTEWTPPELDRAQRFGVFTLPAVLASHSGPTTTRLVKRGVFFTRKVMCLPLGSPPPDVSRTVPATTDTTERQKIEAMTSGNARCMGCHAFINPFGFMQENYDPIGRWRTLDNGHPVDASISVDFLDEGRLATSSPVEALRGFTRSLRFQQCFARQLFRFYMGRDERAADDPVLRQMFFDFANGESQELLAMLRTLAGSPAFTSRSEAP